MLDFEPVVAPTVEIVDMDVKKRKSLSPAPVSSVVEASKFSLEQIKDLFQKLPSEGLRIYSGPIHDIGMSFSHLIITSNDRIDLPR